MENIGNYNNGNIQRILLQNKKNIIPIIKIANSNIKNNISNYYHLNSIDKNSKIMRECSHDINHKKNNFNK
jgi:hypothetical protein